MIPYLEELDERARRIGAVNTIVNDHGRLIGKNTDYYGCRFMLEQAGIEIQGRKVILLGNGGAAQAVQAVLEDLGAAAIVKVKRNPSPETLTYEEAYRDHNDAQVIVNTSPVGMFPAQEGLPVELDQFPQLESVVDVIYNPHRTRLIVEAQKRGCRTATGLSMLTAQAAEAIEAFIGKPVAPKSILRMTAELEREKMNLVLIGMPGCGKSTIAKKLAEISGRPAVDIDRRIVERIGMPIRRLLCPTRRSPVSSDRSGNPGGSYAANGADYRHGRRDRQGLGKRQTAASKRQGLFFRPQAGPAGNQSEPAVELQPRSPATAL